VLALDLIHILMKMQRRSELSSSKWILHLKHLIFQFLSEKS